jgi:hypothetical protein
MAHLYALVVDEVVVVVLVVVELVVDAKPASLHPVVGKSVVHPSPLSLCIKMCRPGRQI